jgi:hypothetical protein
MSKNRDYDLKIFSYPLVFFEFNLKIREREREKRETLCSSLFERYLKVWSSLFHNFLLSCLSSRGTIKNGLSQRDKDFMIPPPELSKIVKLVDVE